MQPRYDNPRNGVFRSAITIKGTSICPIDVNLGSYSHSTSSGLNKICYYLDNEDKRLEKVRKGIQFAKEYTFEKYGDRFFKIINDYLTFKNSKIINNYVTFKSK